MIDRTARTLPPLPLILATLLGIMLQVQLTLHVDPVAARGADFFAFYTGGTLVASGQLYSQDAAKQVARRITDRDEYFPFVRPPWFAAAVRPLALLDPQPALKAWRILMVLAVGLFVLLWPASRWTTLAAAACSFPVFSAVATGQDVPLIVLWLGIAVWLFRRGHHFSAGLVASLCTIKFHLLVFVPLVLMQKRLWRTSAGAAAGATLLFLVSCVVFGGFWPVDYVRLILDPVTNPHPESMYNLRGLCTALSLPPAAEAVLVALVATAVWFAIRHAEPVAALCIAILAGLLVGHHSYLGDLVLLLPVCVYLLSKSRSLLARLPIYLLLLPLPYLLIPANVTVPLVVTLQACVLVALALEARGFRLFERPAS